VENMFCVSVRATAVVKPLEPGDMTLYREKYSPVVA